MTQPAETTQPIASLPVRLIARFIDLSAAFAFFLAAVTVFDLLTPPLDPTDPDPLPDLEPIVYGMLAAALAGLLYEWILVARTGRTFGRWVMGISVVRADGARVGAWRSLLRMLPQMVFVVPAAITPALGATSLVLLIPAVTDPLRRGVHDRLAGTRVIVTRS